ncbi:tRNA lysidine(34) synthetase TilS [Jiella sp. M17.18]|uniref:tRNA lysidine(34) synthetase TilS n=1 Tax=Jiella sp. M17.18 TaxID=3234247 RepID=UPI0034E04621
MRDLQGGRPPLSLDERQREAQAGERGKGCELLTPQGPPGPVLHIPALPPESEPLSADELCRAFSALVDTAAEERCPPLGGIVLAVSGGPDSLALLLAADAFRKSGNGPEARRIHVATVDHRLRPESGAEAAHVAALCRNFGLPHSTPVWREPATQGNLPQQARLARYRLLADFARHCGARLILTAHHEDDQFETHLMARRRGAGSIGLAGMRSLREMAPGLFLGRPFLPVAGDRLKATVAAHGLPAVDDPTNRDTHYERVRIRADLSAGRHDRPALRGEIARHAAARDRIEARLAAAIDAFESDGRLAFPPDGAIVVDRAAVVGLDPDLAFLFVRRALFAVSGREHWPDAEGVRRILSKLADPSVRVSATLAGAGVAAAGSSTGGSVAFFRELGRLGISPEPIDASRETLCFDGRFEVDVRKWSGSGAVVACFGSFGRGSLREQTVPVIALEGGIVAAPEALGGKRPPGAERLDTVPLVHWRFRRDLPTRSTAARAADAL